MKIATFHKYKIFPLILIVPGRKSIMLNKKYLSILSTLLLSCACFGQSYNFLDREITAAGDSLNFVQLKTDTLFNSHQRISFAIFPEESFNRYKIEFAYNEKKLEKTSFFGKENNALIAINGSFFDVDKGGSVTYLEINDSVISKTRSSKLKWAKPDSLIDGAVIITKDYDISIQPARTDQFYEKSKQEAAVMISGPLLLLHSKKVKLPKMEFSTLRHPRTCLCTRNKSVVFIAIDGRRKDAEGMNLKEVQEFLSQVGCVNAVNLDGGGSTTMWIKGRGVVNWPSDKAGERPVANVLLILKK